MMTWAWQAMDSPYDAAALSQSAIQHSVRTQDMYDEEKKVWQWLKESVDKDKEMVARMKRV